MKRSVWMHPWDLEAISPEEMIAKLRQHGLDSCHLAVAYHGGRMLLPGHRLRRVIEHTSATYLPVTVAGRIQPQVCDYSSVIRGLLDSAELAAFPVHAWVVLSHNDSLGAAYSACCTRNVFGDLSSYALCPSHPDVQTWFVELCAAVAREGFAGLQLEALSFMGFNHAGLHDKQGTTVSPLLDWLLSICACPACQAGYGALSTTIAARARAGIDACIETRQAAAGSLAEQVAAVLGDEAIAAILAHRRAVILDLLERIRAACRLPISLRMTPSALFTGGKTGLPFADISGPVDSACLTFFGSTLEQMRSAAAVAADRPERLPLEGGFIFHSPDCRSAADVRSRMKILHEAKFDSVILYCYGMATAEQWKWLQES